MYNEWLNSTILETVLMIICWHNLIYLFFDMGKNTDVF